MELDLAKALNTLENRIGRWPTLFLIAVACLAFISWAFKLIWENLGSPIYHALKTLPTDLVTLDNIEAVILSVMVVLILFSAVLVLILFLIVRYISRQNISQTALDTLANLRSKGINEVLTSRPKNDADLTRWIEIHESWVQDVLGHLTKSFLKADWLSFNDLGIIDMRSFNPNMVYNEEHQRQLTFLAKRLTILETLLGNYRKQ